MKRLFILGIWLGIFLMQIGCIQSQPIVKSFSLPKTVELNESNLVKVSYITTDNLLKNLRAKLNSEQIVLVASFVDVKFMEQSSNFGRIMAECISSRLSQHGYTVVELKLRHSIYIKKQGGEFLLSREFTNISSEHNSQAVVVGTYSVAINDVYVSARIVQSTTGKIISSFDFKLPLTVNLREMVRHS
jgi:TolB-like protein